MPRLLPTLSRLAVLIAGLPLLVAADDLTVTVEAGAYPRIDTPIRVDVPLDRFGADVRTALTKGSVALRLIPLGEGGKSANVQAEWLKRPSGPVQLSWISPSPIPAGKSARYRLEVDRTIAYDGPWSWECAPEAITLVHGKKTVFRYNARPVSSPEYGPIQNRDAYIHPAYTPSGTLITGDFSKSHPHHRGFFFAYAKALPRGGAAMDFWNIHTNKGKIRTADTPAVNGGPVSAVFWVPHRWEDKDGKEVLAETWTVEAYDVPGSPYWLFDLTSTQQAKGQPFEVQPYRYGGMAYRGPEPFVKGTLDVLTAEGRHRVDGNLKPTRWVDLTGPVADGSKDYAGALVADHPANPNHPTVARIHPTTLPFVSFVPASDKPVVIETDRPTLYRYRVLIHDGRPDPDRDERTWRDFAEPPRVTLAADSGVR